MKLDIRHEKQDIQLIPLGDIHLGDKSCNYPKVKKMIDWISTQANARVILMGDLINGATKDSVGNAVYDEDFHGQDQLERMLELLYPIRNKIYGALHGNHEDRIMQRTGYNVTKLLSKSLGCKYYGYGQFIKIKIKKQSYGVYATHGSTGSKLPWTKIRGCLELAKHITADIYLYGHVHDLQVHTQEVEMIQYNQLITDKRYFVLTGGYLNYHDSYAEMKNMIPSKQGSPVLQLSSKEKQVRVSI